MGKEFINTPSPFSATPEPRKERKTPPPIPEVARLEGLVEKTKQKTTSERKAENRQREKQTAKEAQALDRLYFDTLGRDRDALERIELMRTHETLQSGVEKKRESLTAGKDKATNEVIVSTFQGADDLKAYSKYTAGEVGYRIKGPNEIIAMRGVMDPRSGELVIVEDDHISDIEIAARQTDKKDIDRGTVEAMAEYYGITAEEIPVSIDRLSSRLGVESGTQSIREYAVNAIDRLVGFDVTPPTVLRYDEANGLRSVKAAVHSERAETPAHPLNVQDLKDLLELGPFHPGAKSFMRLAALDYLAESMDRNESAVFYDPAAQRFTAIDDSLSMGTHTSDEFPTSPLVSLPIEITQQHTEWELDDEALIHLTNLRDRLLENQESRDLKTSHTTTGERAAWIGDTPYKSQDELGYLEGVYGLVHKHPAIATKETDLFLKRLSTLVEHRKPPILIPVAQQLPILAKRKEQLLGAT